MSFAYDQQPEAEAPQGETPQGDAVENAGVLPRISIQAFCETQAIADTLQQARTDRRASRTQMSVHMGGVAAAIEFYEEAPTPNIIILESQGSGEQLLAELDRLADVCDADTQVIVIGHNNDVLLYRQLMSRGVSEYLVAPIGPVDAIASVGRLVSSEEGKQLGRTVAFLGAKGGVGASTVAHNFAWSMSQDLLKTVTIADFDLPFGTAGLDFNQDPAQGLADAIFAGDRLDESYIDRLLWKCTDRLSLFAAPSTLERDYDLEYEAVESVIDHVRGLVPFTVLDLPHQWTTWTHKTVTSADDIVLVASPDLGNLRNAKNMVDLLKQHRRNDRPPFLVLNQVGVPKRPEIASQEFAEALEIPCTVEIGFDPQLFGMAANNGQMIAEAQANAKPAEAFRQLARAVAGHNDAPAGANGLIAQLMARFTRGGDS